MNLDRSSLRTRASKDPPRRDLSVVACFACKKHTGKKDTHPKAGLVLGANAAADATQAAKIAVFILLGDIIANQRNENVLQ